MLFAAVVQMLSLVTVRKEVIKGSYIIQYAASLGYHTIIRLMQIWRLDVNKKSSLTGGTPLLVAVKPAKRVQDDIVKTVEVLFQCGAGASVDAENKAGDTPLFIAVRGGFEKVVDKLLLAGADGLKVDDEGNTILHLAAKVNAINVCKLIRGKYKEKFADFVYAENKDGRTPIHLAAMHGPTCFQVIFRGEAMKYVSMPDNNGYSPLDTAAKEGLKATFQSMWEEMDQCSDAQLKVERSNLESFITKVDMDPCEWEMLANYLRAFSKKM